MCKVRRFLLVAILASAMGYSCGEQMIAAFGSNSAVVILTSKRCAQLAKQLKERLEKEVLTVQWEKSFDVEILFFSGEKEELSHKNIIILDYITPKSKLENKIKDVAGKEFKELQSGERNFLAKYDLWAMGQVVMVLTAPEQKDLATLIEEQSDRIFDLIDHCVQTRLNKALFYPGEQKDLSQRFFKDYGWTLKLPSGYEVNQKFARDGVVKILKDQPARMITVWRLGKDKPPEASWLDLKKRLAWEYWDQDVVVDETVKIEMDTFVNNEATVLSGRWENKKYTIGGIFETYCFKCEECQCYYIVDLAVFAPGLPKLPLLRELRAIASTFSCHKSM